MKKAFFFLLGLLPLPIGYLTKWCMMTVFYDVGFPYGWVGIFMLGLWCLLGYLFCRHANTSSRTVIFLNAPALIALLLIMVQELILKAYWPNFVGVAVQFFYLPVLGVSYRLAFWAHTMPPVYFVAFILMVGASALGCYLSKKHGAAE